MATNVRLSGAQTSPRAESDIRVNFNDTTKIIAAANALSSTGVQAQFYSSDSGGSWNQTTLPLTGSDTVHSDPAVDWTSDGTAWSITIGISPTTLQLRCYKSTDNGATWTFDSTPSGTQTNVDREIMWTDHSPTSSFKDQIYVIWHTGVPAFVARRTTGAGAAWQTPVQISGSEQTGSAIGADIKSNSVGDVFGFYPDPDGSGKLRVAKSTDGAVTFGSPVDIATLFATTRRLSIPADRADIARGARVYMSGGCFHTAAKNLVYVAWPDLSGESGCTSGAGPGSSAASTCKTRIWFTRSTDGGATWEAARMINNQASLNDQFFCRLAVDETDGKLVIIYNDTVNDSTRLTSDIFMQWSSDDGVSWTTPVQVTTSATDETTSTANSFSYGDYNALTGYAGSFFGCWTDRRNGANEEIWGAPIVLVPKACAFVIERSVLGEDEIDARRTQPANTAGGLPVPDAFRVVVDGFTAAELGINSPSATLTVTPSSVGTTPVTCTGNTSDSGDYGPEVQRFTFHYNVNFPDDSAFSFSTPTSQLQLDVTVGTINAVGQIELIKQPDPFLLHGDPAWLSVDLRVFPVRAGETRFGVTMGADASAAPAFIQQLMAAITPAQFASLSADEQASALYLTPTDGPMGSGGSPVFNFALAQVHYIGLIGAADVRVFFRLFAAQTTSGVFDYPPGAEYRRAPSNPHGNPIPLAGIENGEYVTIPCFATARVDSTVVSMDQQTDDPYNVQTFTAIGGAEVDHFFGCWIDNNQPFKPDGITPNNVLPVNVPATFVDGPFTDPANPPLPISQAVTRNLHQCLIAEIDFTPTAIPVGKDPSNWDKLAQRNIAWSGVGSAQAVSTFEVKSPPKLLPDQTSDELMIDWGGIPDGTVAQLYLPAIKAADILAIADRMYASHRLSSTDQHTIQCQARGITYVPVPRGNGFNYAGLLSVDLPSGLKRGSVFEVVVRQITTAYGTRISPPPPPPQIDIVAPREVANFAVSTRRVQWRKVIGAFQLSIPVASKPFLLVREERDLSVLRWIAQAIPHHSRWYLVFKRYLKVIAGRVTTFGGDPWHILPSPTGGAGKPGHGLCHEPPPCRGSHWDHRHQHDRHALTGKIIGLVFDSFGDFDGFILETEMCEHSFESREEHMEELARRAWAERLRVTVLASREHPHRPLSVMLWPPKLFHD